MIGAMFKLTEKCKIPSRTHPGILDGFQEAQRRYNRVRVGSGGDKASAEAVLNAIVIDFLGRPLAEQDAIVNRNVTRFERLLEEDDLSALEGAAGDSGRSSAPPKDGPRVTVYDDNPAPKRRRKAGG